MAKIDHIWVTKIRTVNMYDKEVWLGVTVLDEAGKKIDKNIVLNTEEVLKLTNPKFKVKNSKTKKTGTRDSLHPF